MRTVIQYVSDAKGTPKAVQIPIGQWEKIMQKLRSYEQQLKLKNDLTEAFNEVEQMRAGKIPKQTLSDFLNEL